MTRFRARRASSQELRLAVVGEAGSAGAPVCGEVSGPAGPATVSLLRVERSPAGTFAFVLSSCRVALDGGRAQFELAASRTLPPAMVGERCRLEYAVRAVCAPTRWTRYRAASPVELSAGEQDVHEDRGRLDRLIPSHPASRFHLELVDAELQGGGQISGRVHVDPDLDRSAFAVTATCQEAWCTNFRFRPRRSPLLWQTRSLWQQSIAVDLDADHRWCAFHFDIPSHLPHAVEGRVIAWRYSVEARGQARRVLADRAVITPLRFDV